MTSPSPAIGSFTSLSFSSPYSCTNACIFSSFHLLSKCNRYISSLFNVYINLAFIKLFVCLHKYYKRITAIKVVIINPIVTGKKFFLTNSMTDTPQKPAIAINDDHAIRVPPPVHIEPIRPIAASVEESMPDVSNEAANDPGSGKPENPDPSNPVTTPMINILKANKNGFCGK